MTQRHFIERRTPFWNEFELLVNGKGRNFSPRAAWFPQAFRELTQDLNTARAHGFDPSVIERLNRLVLEGNQLLYGQRSWSLQAAADFIMRTFPQAVRAQGRGIAAAGLIFYGLAAFTAFLCLRFPELVYEFIPSSQVQRLEEMYNPGAAYYLRPREVSSDADMFGYYIYNNISLAFRTFAGGIIAGFGSLLILSLNGVFFGAAAGHIINKGFSEPFFSFIIGHCSFELTALVISAQAGLLLGYRFFITQGLSRGASLRKAGRIAAPLMAGSALLFLIAAAVEAFWSSRHEFPLWLRFGAGALGWLLLGLYLLLAGRGRRG